TSAYTGRAIAITRQAVISSAVSRRAQPVVLFPVLFNLLTRLSRWLDGSTLFHRGSLWNSKRSQLLLLAQPLPCCFQKKPHRVFSLRIYYLLLKYSTFTLKRQHYPRKYLFFSTFTDCVFLQLCNVFKAFVQFIPNFLFGSARFYTP
ncbi:hypothetical protein, partial [uncultured Gemmiger sp.]|uniref:hypothetical protein n=1 Tax=uncultured Gemmiger sp. TaxID=1623490 RepID=UPI0025F96E45